MGARGFLGEKEKLAGGVRVALELDWVTDLLDRFQDW